MELLQSADGRELVLEGLYNSGYASEVNSWLTSLGLYTGNFYQDLQNFKNFGLSPDGTMVFEEFNLIVNTVPIDLKCEHLYQVLNFHFSIDPQKLAILLNQVTAFKAKPQINILNLEGNAQFGTNMMEWMLSNTDNRRSYFFKALFFYLMQYDQSILDAIVNGLGSYPGVSSQVFVDYMKNNYTGSIQDIMSVLVSYNIDPLNNVHFNKIMYTVHALLPSATYESMIVQYPNYNDLLLTNTYLTSTVQQPYECLNMYRNGFTINDLYNYQGFPTSQIWTDIWAIDDDYEHQLDDFMTTSPAVFIARFAALYPSQFMALQQSTENIYGNGVEGYFARIQSAGYGSVYNRLVEHFASQSSTYTETLLLDDWVLYGSARLATYNISKPLFTVKFDATLNARKFTNITELTFNAVTNAGNQFFSTTRGLKYFELTNHLGNVLAVVSDRKILGTPTVPYAEVFNRIQFAKQSQFAPGMWTAVNAQVINEAGVLKAEDDPAKPSLIPEVAYTFTAAQRPRSGRSYQFKISLARVKTTGTGTWTLQLNGNSNTSHPLSIGNNTINFVPSGDVWQMRLVYSIAGQDIDFRFDNIEIRDMTASNIGSALNAEVVQATHYSPFGAPLAGLAYNKPQETSRKVVVNDNFNQTSSTDGWLRYYPHTTVTQTQGQIRAVSTTTWGTMYKAIQVVKHKNYILRCKIDKGTCTGTIHVPIYNNAGTTFSGFLVINTSGVYEYRFTAHDDIVKVLFEITPSNAPGSFFLLDEITIEEDVTLDNGYRFGFNGQEKDDEVSGDGNSYTAEFWQYDPRLGRRFNIDPRHAPWESPYSVMGDNPIINKDIKGDKWKNGHEKEKRDAEGKVKDAQSNLDDKQKQFNDKYKDVDPNSLKGKVLEQYKNDKKGVIEAKQNLDGAIYDLEIATAKFNAAELLIKEFSGQAPKAYDYWEYKDYDINVEVTNLPIQLPGADQEVAMFNPADQNGEVNILIRIHPDWIVDELQINIGNMAHGLGHVWSGRNNILRDPDSEYNADLYRDIILGRKKIGDNVETNPRVFFDSFQRRY